MARPQKPEVEPMLGQPDSKLTLGLMRDALRIYQNALATERLVQLVKEQRINTKAWSDAIIIQQVQ
jgi:hypothetical protein